jgi:hypothetical protein
MVFLFVLPLSIFALDFGVVFFSPETLSEAVVESVSGSQIGQQFLNDQIMPNMVADTTRSDDFDFNQAFADLDQVEREQIISILVPEDWLDRQIRNAVEALLNWIDEDQAQLAIQLQIEPLKESLFRGGSEQVLEIIVDSWPPCTLEQMEMMSTAAEEEGEVPVVYCEPPEPFRTRLLEYANTELLLQIDQLPPVVDMGNEDPGGNGFENQIEVKRSLRSLRALSQTMWFLAVGLLGLIMALAIRSWTELSRWWGIPIMLGGLVTLLMAIGLSARGGGALLNQVPELQNAEGPIREMVVLLIRGLLDTVVSTIQLHSVFIGLLGLAIFLGGWYLGRNQQKPSAGSMSAASQPAATYDPYSGAGQVSDQNPDQTDGKTQERDSGERPSGIFG